MFSKRADLTAILTITLTVFAVILLAVVITPNIDFLIQFSKDHPFVAPIVIILWRIIAIVIPPLPGGVLSLALIPILGWFPSFIYATIGLMIGASMAFLLARRFREKLVQKFVPLQDLHKWQNKLSGKKEFLTFLIIRITTESAMDFISYIAGMSKISFNKFFWATLIAILPNALFYYLGESIFKGLSYGNSILPGIVTLIFIILIYYIIRKKLSQK